MSLPQFRHTRNIFLSNITPSSQPHSLSFLEKKKKKKKQEILSLYNYCHYSKSLQTISRVFTNTSFLEIKKHSIEQFTLSPKTIIHIFLAKSLCTILIISSESIHKGSTFGSKDMMTFQGVVIFKTLDTYAKWYSNGG